MSYKYSYIKLNGKFNAYTDEDGDSLTEIGPLSSINVIVGSNNSGKSRFLRELIKIKDYEFKIKGLDLVNLSQQLKTLNGLIQIVANNNTNVATFRTSTRGSMKPEEINITYSDTFFKKKTTVQNLQNILGVINSLKNDTYSIESYRGENSIYRFEDEMRKVINENKHITDLIENYIFEEINFRKFYINTLRSLNYFGIALEHRNLDFYKTRIINKYSLNEEELNLEIFTGLNLYNTVRSMLLGDLDQRERIANYENFLSEKLFDNKKVTLIPKEKDDVLHIKIGDEEDRAIYDLGDGVQSLILLTFPLFEVDNGIFFIEEPEIHLHPGLQRKLIEVLKEMKNHQYFITTHSNHFLDLTLDYNDTSIFTFKKTGEQTIVKTVSNSDESILQLLGARNSSVFLSNCTIWVEGVTDRLYIRKFLEFYQKSKSRKIQEDIDYSFVEYGGDNITHWSFLNDEENPINIDRLCGKSILITDKDGEKNLERKANLQSTLKDRYVLLDCNEIENTLSLKTIERVIKKYEKKNKFTMPTFKSEFPHKDIKIGKFIEEKIFDGQTIKRKGGYREDSGTIKNKVDFCKKAIDEMTEDEMSSVASNLAKKIYDFVLKNKDI